MPRKLPANVSQSLAERPVAKKKSRSLQNPSAPSFSDQAFAPKLEPLRRPEKSSSSAAAIAVLLALIIIAFGAYYASVYFKNKAAEEAALLEQAASEAATEAAAPEAPVDPTADWLAFASPAASSSASLSFKYPKELNLTESAGNLTLSNDNASTTQVNVSWVESKKALKDYLAALDKLNEKSWEGKPSVSIATSTDTVVISGWPAVFRQEKLLAAGLEQYVAYVKASSAVYAISLAAPRLDQNLLAFFVAFLNNFKLGAQN